MTLQEFCNNKNPLISDRIELDFEDFKDREIEISFDESHDTDYKRDALSDFQASDVILIYSNDVNYVMTVIECLASL